jgi:hypothetical protein
MGCAGTDEKKDQIPLDAADFVRDVENSATCEFLVTFLAQAFLPECNIHHTRTVYSIAVYGTPLTHCSHGTQSRQWIVPGSKEWEALTNLGKTNKEVVRSKTASFCSSARNFTHPT